jgi:hypothetical protein
MTDAAAMVRKTLGLLFEPGDVVEMRLPDTRYKTVSGYYDDFDAFARDAARWDGEANVYLTANPVNPVLLARSPNKLTQYAKHTTSDADILFRRWLLVDFDPRRPAGISSSETEHQAAIERAKDCARTLTREGWPRPILADSGNGAHLLWRINLPRDDDGLVKGVLAALALRWDDEVIAVDQTSFNPARIWKVYGTRACKGANVPDRPHRYAEVMYAPA